ncbi:hypothetical protein C8Q75DRAFT_788402 [Abortiporus biennis]|nr:hypothetical protein C8Q75DRAFT_788402 [Abortiporus biennis]
MDSQITPPPPTTTTFNSPRFYSDNLKVALNHREYWSLLQEELNPYDREMMMFTSNMSKNDFPYPTPTPPNTTLHSKYPSTSSLFPNYPSSSATSTLSTSSYSSQSSSPSSLYPMNHLTSFSTSTPQQPYYPYPNPNLFWSTSPPVPNLSSSSSTTSSSSSISLPSPPTRSYIDDSTPASSSITSPGPGIPWKTLSPIDQIALERELEYRAIKVLARGMMMKREQGGMNGRKEEKEEKEIGQVKVSVDVMSDNKNSSEMKMKRKRDEEDSQRQRSEGKKKKAKKDSEVGKGKGKQKADLEMRDDVVAGEVEVKVTNKKVIDRPQKATRQSKECKKTATRKSPRVRNGLVSSSKKKAAGARAS